MFGSRTQIKFSVFESNYLRVPSSFILFGSYIQFFNSNSFTVQTILNSGFLRTPNSCFHFSFSVLNVIIIIFFIFRYIKRFALSLSLLDSRRTIANEATPARIVDEATKSTSADEEATCGVALWGVAWRRKVGDPPSWVFAFFLFIYYFFFFPNFSDLVVSHVLVLLVLVLGLWACDG